MTNVGHGLSADALQGFVGHRVKKVGAPPEAEIRARSTLPHGISGAECPPAREIGHGAPSHTITEGRRAGSGIPPGIRVLAAAAAILAPEQFLLAAERAADPDHAVVTLSTGERSEGTFALTAGRKLELYDVQKSKRLAIDPKEIARVSAVVEEEKLEQGWMFPYKYPLRTLQSEVTLTSGETLRGRVTCVFYLEGEDDTRRFFLVANQKGEKGQTLEDLVYVKQVVLPNRAVGGKTTGTIRAPAPAAVVHVDREASFQPPFTGLPTGRYDVFLFRGRAIRYGLSGGPIADEDRRQIEAKVASVEEFFTRKRVVGAAREGPLARALIELTRPEESHDKGWRYARWEVWTFEPTQEAWAIRKRLFLHRERFPANQGMPAFEYAAEEKLRGVPENAAVE
jgi:hypothetical protein